MSTQSLISRKLFLSSWPPSWRLFLALSAFVLMLGAAKADESIPSSPENIQFKTDWIDHSPQPLTMGHIYRSFGDPDEDADIGMGKGWTHSWTARIKMSKFADGTLAPHKYMASVAVVLPSGVSAVFLKDSGENKPWLPATGVDLLRGKAGETWLYYRASDDSWWEFDSKGWLTKITLRNGWVYSILHVNGKVASVTNSFGRKLRFNYTPADRLNAVALPDGNSINYDYNTTGSLRSVKVNSYQVRGYTYEHPNNYHLLTGINNSQGNQLLGFTYNPDGALIETKRIGVPGVFQVSTAGATSAGSAGMLVAAGTDDPNWYKASITTTAPDGSTHTREYQGTATGIRVVSESSSRFKAFYQEILNQNKMPAFQEDFKGNKTSYWWDNTRQLLTQVTAASNRTEAQTTRIEWHASMTLPTKITEAGRVTRLSYDGKGNLAGSTITDTSTNKIYSSAWAYNPNGLPYSYTDTAGQTVFGYDSKGNLNKITDPQGRISQYTHDGAGRVLTAIDPSGLVRSYSYNPRGKLTSFSAGGLLTTLNYLSNDKLSTVIFANGYAINYQYDAAQRTSSWNDNRGASGQYTLDQWGNRTTESVLDSAANIAFQVQRSINSINQVSDETVGDSQSTTLTYDANGDLTAVSNALGQTTTLAVDGLRRLNKIIDPLNNSASLTYNQLDAVTAAKDFNGVATHYSRNALGNASQESTPDAGTAAATYDVRGLLASTTDATGRTIGLERDVLGRITKINYNNSTSSVLRYDLPGSTYNSAAAPNASIGQLSEVQDPDVTTQYQRDGLGRLLRKSQILANGNSRFVAYNYVPAGQGGAGSVQSITYPSGKQLLYQYDSTGQITGMLWDGVPLVASLQWSPLGMPSSWRWPGILAAPGSSAALAEARSYNSAGQLTHTGILDLSWDAAGRVSAIEQSQMLPASAPGLPAQSARIASAYSYDAAGRMTASGHSLQSTPAVSWPQLGSLATGLATGLVDVTGYTSMGYAYDFNGNRLAASMVRAQDSGSSASTTLSYSIATDANRLLGVTSTSDATGQLVSTKTYQYDAAGAITSATTSGATSASQYLHYGANSRVAKVTSTASSAEPNAVSYLYNSASQRILKTDARQSTTAPITEHTLYSDEDSAQLLGTYSNQRSASSAAPAGAMDSTEVIYLPTAQGLMPIAAQINGRLYAIHTDHLNTPRRLTNSQGQVAWQWLLSGFGEVQPTTGAGGYVQSDSPAAGSLPGYAPEVTFNLRYPGQQWDEETGLSYNVNRYYGPQEGRYIQADPIGLDGGWNRFGYVGGNPLNAVDPQGLNWVLAANRTVLWGQGLYYRYGPAITQLIHEMSGVNGAVVVAAPVNPLIAQIPMHTAHMTPVAAGIVQAVENGAFACLAKNPQLFRGGNFLSARLGVDVKVAADGLVYPLGKNGKAQGLSLNSNPLDPFIQKYGGAFPVNSLPNGLQALQSGKDGHFVASPEYPMTFDIYQQLLNQIQLGKFNILP